MTWALFSADELTALWLSGKVALVSTALAVVPGIACAWWLARGKFRGKLLLDALIHVPLVAPPTAIGYLLLVVLGRNGWLGRWLYDIFGLEIAFTWRGASVASAVMGFPLLVRAARLGIELVDCRIEDAARTLGASPLHVLRTVTLPLASPGILAGVVLCFARSLGEFGATILVAGNVVGETRTLPLAVYVATQSPGGEAQAVRLVALCFALAIVALMGSEVLARRAARRLGSQRC